VLFATNIVEWVCKQDYQFTKTKSVTLGILMTIG